MLLPLITKKIFDFKTKQNVICGMFSFMVQQVKTGFFLRSISHQKETFEEKYIHVNSQKINYLKVGKGPLTLVCFPGALGTIWSDFKPQIENLNKEKFTIIVWEQPGHGKSRCSKRIFTSRFFQEDADTGYEFIKALGIKRFSLLGWSDGGNAGLILAAKYPEVVEKIVVWGTNSYITSQDMEIYEGIHDINNWSMKIKAPLIKIYGENQLQEMQNSLIEVHKVILEEGGEIYSSLLNYIECPTLILHGAKDPLVNLEHAQHIQKKIKNARLYIFPDGKHNIHLRYPNEFNTVVTNFLLGQDD